MSLFVDKVQPSFPALLVCEDGSVGALYDLSCWTDDVDRWFWSSAAEYLIDVHGVTFIQDGERANDGRPSSVPKWKSDSSKSEEEMLAILVKSDGDDWLDRIELGQVLEQEQRLRYIIDAFARHDSR